MRVARPTAQPRNKALIQQTQSGFGSLKWLVGCSDPVIYIGNQAEPSVRHESLQAPDP